MQSRPKWGCVQVFLRKRGLMAFHMTAFCPYPSNTFQNVYFLHSSGTGAPKNTLLRVFFRVDFASFSEAFSR